MFRDVGRFCVRPDEPVRNAISHIDAGQCGIALVVDNDRRLVGTITDGDIRRAILARQDMDAPIQSFLRVGQVSGASPVVARVGAAPEQLLREMTTHSIRQMPLVDDEGRVHDLVVLEDLLPNSIQAVRAVIMAGGFGTRLLPLTEHLPKPMLPVAGRPLIEHTIAGLRQAGIRLVHISTHYKAEKIVEHFGDGKAFGVDLRYVNEDRPLGTGGALGLMPPPRETELVINGDILTQVDFRSMLQFHKETRAEMTVGVRPYELQVPYGVIECEGTSVRAFDEKPQVGFMVNAGVYLLEPSVYELIANRERFNMTDLIRWLLDAGRPVAAFAIREYWRDVGQHSDYLGAQMDFENHDAKR